MRNSNLWAKKISRSGVKQPATVALVSLERVLSKFGLCSRRQAETLIKTGHVRINGRTVRDAGVRVDPKSVEITVDSRRLTSAAKTYLLLNKPRGLLTTRDDPQGRGTVYDCLAGHGLPFLAPVGRLDKASEGLLLMTNDTKWAHHILEPSSNIDKVYHVKISCIADDELLSKLKEQKEDNGQILALNSASLLRRGGRNSWLEVTLNEGKNRQIRRLLYLNGVEVLRLVRVAVGAVRLGEVQKGCFRFLTDAERTCLAATGSSSGNAEQTKREVSVCDLSER